MPTTAVGEDLSRDRTTFRTLSSLWYSTGMVTFYGTAAVAAAVPRAGGCCGGVCKKIATGDCNPRQMR